MKQMNSEKITNFLNKLLAKSYNRYCAECKKPSPTWASTTLSLFVCHECSGLHRKLGPQKSMIKSITLNEWTIDELRRMHVGGNKNKITEDDSIDFMTKYKNTDNFIKKIDLAVKNNEKEFPGESFMELTTKNSNFGKVSIKKKSVAKFSQFKVDDFINNDSVEKIYKPEEVKEEIIREIAKEIDSPKIDNFVLEKKNINTEILKKTVSMSRSPFIFSEKEIDEESGN